MFQLNWEKLPSGRNCTKNCKLDSMCKTFELVLESAILIRERQRETKMDCTDKNSEKKQMNGSVWWMMIMYVIWFQDLIQGERQTGWFLVQCSLGTGIRQCPAAESFCWMMVMVVMVFLKIHQLKVFCWCWFHDSDGADGVNGKMIMMMSVVKWSC